MHWNILAEFVSIVNRSGTLWVKGGRAHSRPRSSIIPRQSRSAQLSHSPTRRQPPAYRVYIRTLNCNLTCTLWIKRFYREINMQKRRRKTHPWWANYGRSRVDGEGARIADLWRCLGLFDGQLKDSVTGSTRGQQP